MKVKTAIATVINIFPSVFIFRRPLYTGKNNAEFRGDRAQVKAARDGLPVTNMPCQMP
jgi:hypothetical protein